MLKKRRGTQRKHFPLSAGIEDWERNTKAVGTQGHTHTHRQTHTYTNLIPAPPHTPPNPCEPTHLKPAGQVEEAQWFRSRHWIRNPRGKTFSVHSELHMHEEEMKDIEVGAERWSPLTLNNLRFSQFLLRPIQPFAAPKTASCRSYTSDFQLTPTLIAFLRWKNLNRPKISPHRVFLTVWGIILNFSFYKPQVSSETCHIKPEITYIQSLTWKKNCKNGTKKQEKLCQEQILDVYSLNRL